MCLVRGVPAQGCTCPGGVPGPGGCTWSQGVYLPGGVPGLLGDVYLVLGGVPARGCTWSCGGVPGQVLPPVDRHTPVKT